MLFEEGKIDLPVAAAADIAAAPSGKVRLFVDAITGHLCQKDSSSNVVDLGIVKGQQDSVGTDYLLIWTFRSDEEGFTSGPIGNEVTFDSVFETGIQVANDGVSGQTRLITPSFNIGPSGVTYSRVKLSITVVSLGASTRALSENVICQYSTSAGGSGAHGFSGSFQKSVVTPDFLKVGDEWVLDFDMRASTVPSDWIAGSLTALQITLLGDANSLDSVVRVNWVALCVNRPPTRLESEFIAYEFGTPATADLIKLSAGPSHLLKTYAGTSHILKVGADSKIGAAVADTDYATPSGVSATVADMVTQASNSAASGKLKVSAGANKVASDFTGTTGLVKVDGSGVASIATAGTDYAVPSVLGLWDFWMESRIYTTNANGQFWLGAALSSGNNNTGLPSAAQFGYNSGGVLIRSSTIADGGYRYMSIAGADYFGVISRKFQCQFLWRTAFTNNTVRIGFSDAIANTTAVANGAWFECDGSGVISAKTAKASTGTTHGTTYSASLDTAYTFDVEANAAGTSVRFRIYAGTSTTAVYDQTITTNIPNAAANNFGNGIVCSNSGTTASDIGILYRLACGSIEGYNKARA